MRRAFYEPDVTHLVVEPRHGETGRLVPLGLVEHSSPDQVDLAGTRQEFDRLEECVNVCIPGFDTTLITG
jgi:hypothetical protein